MLETKYLLTLLLIGNAIFLIDSATTRRPDLTDRNQTTLTPGSNTQEVTSGQVFENENVENATKSPIKSDNHPVVPNENPFAEKFNPKKTPIENNIPSNVPDDIDVPKNPNMNSTGPSEKQAENEVSTGKPVDNPKPTKVPVNKALPTEATEAPVVNEILTEAPLENDLPTEAPVEKVLPTEAPVEKVETTEAPLDKAEPAMKPVDIELPAKVPVDIDLPTKAPVDNIVPTDAPIDTVEPAKKPVDIDLPTKAPVDIDLPTKAPIDIDLPTKAQVSIDLPTKVPVENAEPSTAPVTKPTSADSLSINEPVKITDNDNVVPTDVSITTDPTNANNDNGPDSESLFPSDIDPFAVGMDPFHSLFGDSHGISIGSSIVPSDNNSDSTNQPVETTTDTATPTPFPIISSTKESNRNPTIPDVSTTAGPDDTMENSSDDISTTVQPVTMATSKSPAIEQTWTHLCSQCNSVDQVCNYPHPDDCQIFIECFRQGDDWRATPMLCGHGTFFSEKTKRCDHAYLADCKKDRCIASITEYKHDLDTNCATYWKCDNKMSKATCCPEGQAYVNGFGCVADENCTAQCPNSKNTTFADLPEDFFDFKEDGICKTNVHLDFEQSTLTNESPKHNVVAVRNGMDRIVIKDGHGVFKGRSYIYVPYYNHNDYQVKQAFIQFRFLPFTGEGANKQVLVSTCSTNYESTGYSPSIEISLDKAHNLIVFTGVTHKRTVQFDLPYRHDQWNKVQFIYDGINTFNATVFPETDKDEIQRKQIVLEGVSEKNPLIKPTMPLRIGSCYRGAWRNDVDDFFQGEMDDIYIASCVPELD